MGDPNRGLYGKYIVRRVDGSDAPLKKHDGCNYFVLDLTHDPYAIPALRAYARSCAREYPLLAADLNAIADGNKLIAEKPSLDLDRRAAALGAPPTERKE